MIRTRFSILPLLVATIVSIPLSGIAADGDDDVVIEFDPAIFTPPSAGVEELAREHGVPFSGFSKFAGHRELRSGDSVTIVVTALSGERTKQWLLMLQVSELTPREEKHDQPPEQTLYSTSGHQFTFASKPAALILETWGPAPGPEEPDQSTKLRQKTGSARGVVNAVFLGLGLNNTCSALIRLHEARSDGRVDPDRRMGIYNSPVSEKEAREGLDLVTQAGLTLEDERAVAGSVPAMLEFFDVAARSNGLREILWEIMDKPSMWSIIRHFGRIEAGITYHSRGVKRVPSEPWGLSASTELYQIPFTLNLNDEPALHCVMVVTDPRPPLLTSAGIIGISAHQPGAPARRAVVRIIAARRADDEGTESRSDGIKPQEGR